MSSLQISLLILAVALVAAVVGYNYTQNRKVAKRLERSREGMAKVVTQEHQRGMAPVAAPMNRAEPVLSGFASENSHHADLPPGQIQEGAVEQSVPLAGTQAALSDDYQNAQGVPSETSTLEYNEPGASLAQTDPYMLRSFGLHPSADCVVQIRYAQAVASDRLLAAAGSIRRVGAKPVIFEGVAADGEFEPLVPGERFSALRAGVLMANRHGPLNAMEFSDFASLVQKIADSTDGKVELPDMNEVLNRARSLDSHCAELDAQIGLNIITADALSPADLGAAAREFGLVEKGNNRFVKLGEHSEVLFSFSLADAPNRITLLLDVPRAPSLANPWSQMVACANRTVARFGGRLVDDADKPLTPQSLDRITSQLSQRYQSLIDASFNAGSPVALRLFN
jgi:hypothetical protein